MHTKQNENLLLTSEISRTLYHNAAGTMPIFDDCPAISIQALSQNTPLENITQLMLLSSHGNSPFLRSVSQVSILNQKIDAQQQFFSFINHLNNCPGSSLYLKTQLFFQKLFDIYIPVNTSSAQHIWDASMQRMREKKYTLKSILSDLGVSHLLYPFDLADTLKQYQTLVSDTTVPSKILPIFVPDSVMYINHPGFVDRVAALSNAAKLPINTIDDLLSALENRIDYFHAHGARSARCSFGRFPAFNLRMDKAEKALKAVLSGEKIKTGQIESFQSILLYHLGVMYAKRNWSQHLRLGLYTPINNDSSSSSVISHNDQLVAGSLSSFLVALDTHSALPNTAITCSNPWQYACLVDMASRLNGQHESARIQVQLKGYAGIQQICQQIDMLAEHHLLTSSIGLVDEDPTFLHFLSHDYVRRILCQQLCEWSQCARLSNNFDELVTIVNKIAYHNIKNFYSA